MTMKHLFKIRRDLHQIPELAYNEHKTTAYIYDYLSKLPDLVIHKFPFTGLLVEYNGDDDKEKAEYTLFRADMDALPIEEKTDCNFHSKHKGIMHACGHDLHMTVLIGLIEEVVKSQLKKNVLFLFQPAEEGEGGAERILATKIFENYNIKEVYALHVSPSLPVGTISSCPGVIFGIPQEFDVIFRGKSSHAANPHLGNDAIQSASHFAVSTDALAAKYFSPKKSYLFHIGKITGGNIRNIVADECRVEGTLRTFENMEELKELVKKSAKLSAEMFNTEEEVLFLRTYDPVINSPRLYDKLKSSIPTTINFIEAEPALAGEDFGFFTSRYEGLLFWLGAGDDSHDLHSPFFLADEKAILTGITTFKRLLQ